jgi:hypothetical protein
MLSVTQVSKAMQTILTKVANQAGRETGFIQREVKLNGASFCQSVVFGWLANPQATLEELSQTAAVVGVQITAQGLEQRFSEAGAKCLYQVLQESVNQVIAAEAVAIPVLQRFRGVYLEDSSTLVLPAELAEVWTGCGNATGQGEAALKLNVRLEVNRGLLQGPVVTDGRSHDRQTVLQEQPLPAGSLRLADINYWSLDQFQDLAEQGNYWLSRFKLQTAIFTRDGQRWSLVELLQAQKQDQVEVSVELGVHHRLPARLVTQRLPSQVAQHRRRRVRTEARRRGKTATKTQLFLADWLVFVTNAPPEKLSFAEIFVVARVRWQIELLFKLWKSHNLIDESRSDKPWRRLCEIYAKLIGVVIQHWMLLAGCWHFSNRSLFKAAQTIQKHAWYLASVFSCSRSLGQAITSIQRCLAAGCRINKRKQGPHTYQLLLALDDGGLA